MDRRVAAELQRSDHDYGDVVIQNGLAYVCPHCQTPLGFPQASSGRIARALQSRAPATTKEFRVPVELEDLALAVHASFGTLGVGDDFTLPLYLGLQGAGRAEAPRPSWKALDDKKCDVRVRPRLSPDTERRLQGLARTWDAVSTSDVVRWLIVAAWVATLAGLRCEQQRRPMERFDNAVIEGCLSLQSSRMTPLLNDGNT